MTTDASPFTRSGVFSAISDELDPPPERLALARSRYEDLGRWIEKHAASSDYNVSVYAQGSYNLGTTNRDPFTDEFDFDLVVCVEVSKKAIEKLILNIIVFGWLSKYVKFRQETGGEFEPEKLKTGKRAYTILYSDAFHMDILPVVPDVEGEIDADGGEPSWLTDKELTRWHPTNPKGFGEYFRNVSFDERQILARKAAVTIEDLPSDRGPKTSLQMAVKLIKRHRDYAFHEKDPGLAPPSALITALATKAYEKATPAGGSVADVISTIVPIIPDMLVANGQLVVANPTCPTENYADRYRDSPAKRRVLESWLTKLQSDVDTVSTTKGRLREAVDEAFGPGLGERVATRLGDAGSGAKEAGLLSANAAGTLSTLSTLRELRALRESRERPSRPHTFYGDDDGDGTS